MASRNNIHLSLEDIFSGIHKRIRYRKSCKCNDCNSTGGETIQCNTCGGQGVLIQIQNTPFGRIQNTVPCSNCRGSGRIITKQCNSCNGNGVNIKEVEYEFDIPKGIMDGEMLRIMDMGNSIKNGIDGDLIINMVELPHDKFKRVGNDLHQTLNLSFKDLVLGNDDVQVDTLEGKIKIKIKKGTDVGSMLRIPKRGFVRNNEKGDMILEVWMDVPKNLIEEEENKIKNLTI